MPKLIISKVLKNVVNECFRINFEKVHINFSVEVPKYSFYNEILLVNISHWNLSIDREYLIRIL